jgi:hypothetical protein
MASTLDDASASAALEDVLARVLAADEADDRRALADIALDLIARTGVSEAAVARLQAALRQAIIQAPSRQRKDPSCA